MDRSNLSTLLILTVILLIFTCCSAVLSPLPVGLIGNATFPINYEPGLACDSTCVVLGTAEGKAIASSFLGLFASGDASIYTAYQEALSQYEDAEFLTDIKIDYNAMTTLGIIGTYTTIVRGNAVKKITLKSKKIAPNEILVTGHSKEQTNDTPEFVHQEREVNTTETSEDNLIVGHWSLESTILPNGNILDNKTGLKGSLIISAKRGVKLLFIQGEKGVEFRGKFYKDSNGSIIIEVVQVGRSNQNDKIIYNNVTLDNNYLVFVTDSKRTYRWKKS